MPDEGDSASTEALAAIEEQLQLSQREAAADCAGFDTLARLWLPLSQHIGAASFDEKVAIARPAAGAPPPQPLRFEVELEAAEGEPRWRLGLKCAVLRGALLVLGLEPGSPAGAWTAQVAAARRPWLRLLVGSAILCVNGIAGDLRRMQQELQASRRVRMLCCSPPTLACAVDALRAACKGSPATAVGGALFWEETAKELLAVGAFEGLARARGGDGPALAEASPTATHAADSAAPPAPEAMLPGSPSFDDGAAPPAAKVRRLDAEVATLVATATRRADDPGATLPSGAPSSARTQACSEASAAQDGITIIVTTSPVPSNPSTDMLAGVLKTWCSVPELRRAPKILVCDGYRRIPDGQKPRHKAGKILSPDAEKYSQFIRSVEFSVRAADDDDDPFASLRVLPLDEHHGFGYAVKRALQLVRTSFVLVVQHDQELVRPFDLPAVLRALSAHPEEVKYVGLASATTVPYDQIVRSKYGLELAPTTAFGVPLMPLIFFYDKPHICSLRHYQEVIFGPESVIKRGEFIEESMGKAQRADILDQGMGAHRRYGTYQLHECAADGKALVHVRHVNGRAFLSPEQRLACGWPAVMRFSI